MYKYDPYTLEKILSIPKNIELNPRNSFCICYAEINQLFVDIHITFDDLLNALQESPHFISQWLTYSENKRTSNGWFVRQVESGKYEVGFYDGKGIVDNLFFNDSVAACALFISKEITSVSGGVEGMG